MSRDSNWSEINLWSVINFVKWISVRLKIDFLKNKFQGKSALIARFLATFSARPSAAAVNVPDEQTIALEYRFGTRILGVGA